MAGRGANPSPTHVFPTPVGAFLLRPTAENGCSVDNPGSKTALFSLLPSQLSSFFFIIKLVIVLVLLLHVLIAGRGKQ